MIGDQTMVNWTYEVKQLHLLYDGYFMNQLCEVGCVTRTICWLVKMRIWTSIELITECVGKNSLIQVSDALLSDLFCDWLNKWPHHNINQSYGVRRPVVLRGLKLIGFTKYMYTNNTLVLKMISNHGVAWFYFFPLPSFVCKILIDEYYIME